MLEMSKLTDLSHMLHEGMRKEQTILTWIPAQ